MEFTLPPNPYLNEDDGKWYWTDETGFSEGPYETEAAAKADLERYCKEFLDD